jgi:hypothetical protein
MREDLVTPATARRLESAGIAWQPQISDWCVVLGGVHNDESFAGLWLVMAVTGDGAMLGLVDAAGQWPASRVAARDCLWLPTAGKLKTWLRARGYRVATGDLPPRPFSGSHSGIEVACRITRVGAAAPEHETLGANEAEAVAAAALAVLGAQGVAG